VGFSDEVQLSASQRYGVVPQDFLEAELDSRVMAAFKGLESFKLVVPDDFVISLRSFQGGIEHSAYRGVISPAYTVMAPDKDVYPPFFRHCLKERAFISRLNAVVTGIRDGKTIKYDEFGELALPLPPLPTQKAIAAYLDRKTAAIDALIEEKEKLIALLAEKRAALINRAVTKGLNPDVPMKDSGVPWIGEIPAHWEVKCLKFACVLQRGFDLPTQSRSDGDVPIYGGGGVTGFHDEAMVFPPGVVTGRYGTVGEAHLVDVPFWPLNTSLYVKQFWGNVPAYIRHLLSAVPMKAYSGKSAVPGVDRNDLHVIPVALPSPDEQKQIVAELAVALGRLEDVERRLADSASRLTEYRQTLITAAVTGQIDVSSEVTS